MCALVTRSHFRSRGKMAITPFDPPCVVENPMLHANFMTFMEPELFPIEFCSTGIGIFYLFWLLWPWPWPDNLHIWTLTHSLEIYRVCKYELPMSCTLSNTVWQTDIQTDRQTGPKLYTTPLRRWLFSVWTELKVKFYLFAEVKYRWYRPLFGELDRVSADRCWEAAELAEEVIVRLFVWTEVSVWLGRHHWLHTRHNYTVILDLQSVACRDVDRTYNGYRNQHLCLYRWMRLLHTCGSSV